MVKNAVTTTYTYNANNQLLTELGAGVTYAYSYDKNGNLVSKTSGGSTTSYLWDWENRLLSVTEPAGTTAYEYDGVGNRISKTQAGVKTKYINDAARGLVQVLMETDDTGAVQAIYNYGNDLISMNRAGVNSYYNYDGLGSTRQLTDESEAVVASYAYDGYGNLIASSGTNANPYGFAGEQQFGEADNLVFLRARYYHPTIGRFISRDPIGYKGGLNLYAYCGNNPINLTDPYGTSSSSCIEKLNEAIKKVSKAIASGNCKKWFDSHGGFSGSYRIHLRSACHPLCMAGVLMWTWPFSNDISVCPAVCDEDVSLIALLVIHEIAHHYCTIGPGREDCANSAMAACGGDI